MRKKSRGAMYFLKALYMEYILAYRAKTILGAAVKVL